MISCLSRAFAHLARLGSTREVYADQARQLPLVVSGDFRVGRAFGLAWGQRAEYRRRQGDFEPGSLVRHRAVPAEGLGSEW